MVQTLAKGRSRNEKNLWNGRDRVSMTQEKRRFKNRIIKLIDKSDWKTRKHAQFLYVDFRKILEQSNQIKLLKSLSTIFLGILTTTQKNDELQLILHLTTSKSKISAFHLLEIEVKGCYWLESVTWNENSFKTNRTNLN